jgi:hypothetical protein
VVGVGSGAGIARMNWGCRVLGARSWIQVMKCVAYESLVSILGLMTYRLQSILSFAALTCHDVPGSTLGEPAKP